MDARPLTHRVALIAVVLTYALLALGGLVTSRDAGMIFRDWPLSEGSVNPDGWLSNADKFSEHGHRILGALTGMATVALAVLLQRHDRRRWVKVLGWTAVAAVIAQGLLGGLRVTENDTFLALIHGCTGQVYFCLMIALAYLTRRDEREPGEPDARMVTMLAAGAWLATIVQLVLGARIRHIHGPVHNHLLGALIVSGSVLWLFTWTWLRHGPALRRPAALLLALLVVQAALGLSTAHVLSPDNRTFEVTLAQITMPSVHQAVGALLLAMETVILLRAWRRRTPADAALPEAAPAARRPAPRAREAVA